jgi:hypothetical protein
MALVFRKTKKDVELTHTFLSEDVIIFCTLSIDELRFYLRHVQSLADSQKLFLFSVTGGASCAAGYLQHFGNRLRLTEYCMNSSCFLLTKKRCKSMAPTLRAPEFIPQAEYCFSYKTWG